MPKVSSVDPDQSVLKDQSDLGLHCFSFLYSLSAFVMADLMKKVNKQCLLDTPRTVRVREKTW